MQLTFSCCWICFHMHRKHVLVHCRALQTLCADLHGSILNPPASGHAAAACGAGCARLVEGEAARMQRSWVGAALGSLAGLPGPAAQQPAQQPAMVPHALEVCRNVTQQTVITAPPGEHACLPESDRWQP